MERAKIEIVEIELLEELDGPDPDNGHYSTWTCEATLKDGRVVGGLVQHHNEAGDTDLHSFQPDEEI